MMKRLCHRARRRGVTLIELLVVIAAASVVMGLVLGVGEESQKMTTRITRQQGALQYCQAAMDQAVLALQGAVAPADLPQAALARQMQFKPDTLTFASYAGDGDRALRLITLQNKPASAAGGGGPEKMLQQLGGATGQVEREKHEDLVQTGAEKFAPKIAFAYAAPADPGQPVAYTPTWPAGTLPALIRITVEGALDDGTSSRTVTLQTAVRPGAGAGGAL